MYVIIEPIQSGTFSIVYRAWDRRGQRYVALKVILRENYRDEIETMRLLGGPHPNICSMLDFYGDESNFILVLEHCALGDMCDFIESSKRQGNHVSPINLCLMVEQLYSAISYAHSLGIAHRDIKPENILITAEGTLKLADWGHAVCGQWSTDTNVGTDAYRGPETFSGEPYDNFKADYWSFGLTLLYTTFGKTPFKCAKNSDGTIDPYPYCNENFAEFVLDPHQFMHRFFIKPLLESQDSPLPYGNGLTPVFDIGHMCRTVADLLVNVDAHRRDTREFINVMKRAARGNDRTSQFGSTIKLPPFLRIKS